MPTETTPDLAALKNRAEPTLDTASAPARRRSLEWIVLLALVLLMLAQLWTSVTQLSITSDEIDHLHAAYRYWQCNDFGWNPEHPPLVKILAGLPLQAMRINDPLPQACGALNTKVVDFLAGHQFIFANPERMLTAARFAVSLFPVLLLVTVWFFARKMFGLPVAIITGILITFEPNVLANGPLVTTDVAATLGFLFVTYALYCYATEPDINRLLALGLAIGFAFCAKYSMIVLVVIAPTVLAFDAILFGGNLRGRKLLRYAGALVTVAAIALTILWACYGFRYTARPGGSPVWDPPRLLLAQGAVPTRVVPALKTRRLLPEAYLVGLQDVLVESEIGRPSFLLGKMYRSSNWFYFPIEASIKFTVPVLLMALISAISLGFWRSRRRDLFFLMAPAIMFFVFCLRSGLNIGVRHLMPILPPLIIFAAAGTWDRAQGHRWSRTALLALLTWQVVTTLHAFPNYISYANEFWGGPGEAYRYLSHSDVDWGQAQKMVRQYVDQTHPANCFYVRSYNNLNSDYGIPCRGISEIQWDPVETPFTGTLLAGVSAVNGVGFKGVSAEVHRALKNLKPIAKLGGSAVLVYEGTFDIRPITAMQLVFKSRREGADGEADASFEDAQRAIALDPLNADAHVLACTGYNLKGDVQKAQQECEIGLTLVKQDPQYSSQQVKHLEDFIVRNGLKVE